MDLYKTAGANPMSGCLPMVDQKFSRNFAAMDSQSDHASTARPGAQDRTQEKEIRPVGEHKYTVASTGSRIEEFLDIALDDMDMDVEYEVLEGVHTHPDLED